MVPKKCRCQNLLFACIRQQITRYLPGKELVIAHVPVECADQPVAPGPLRAVFIILIAVGIGIARYVQPMHRHFLAIGFLVQQVVHNFFICLPASVGPELLLHFQCRRQARNVQGSPFQQMALLSLFAGG
ncbi:hypothetical protein D3C86_1585420 [compost metagenome]